MTMVIYLVKLMQLGYNSLIPVNSADQEFLSSRSYSRTLKDNIQYKLSGCNRSKPGACCHLSFGKNPVLSRTSIILSYYLLKYNHLLILYDSV